MAIARLYDFTPGTPITSAEVDSEFNQLCNLLNGTSTDVETLLYLNHGTNAVLTLNQIGAGPNTIWKLAGTEKARISNGGVLCLGTTQTPATNSRLLINASSASASITVEGNTSTTILADYIAHASASANLSIFRISRGSTSDIRAQIYASGKILTVSGFGTTAPTGTSIVLGGALNNGYTAVGNVGSGEDDLQTFTVKANTLAADGDYIDCFISGVTAANGVNKQIKGKFNGTSFFDTGVVTWNNKDWVGHYQLVRYDTDKLRISGKFDNEDGSFTNHISTEITGLDFTTDLILKFTGEATNNNDIIQNTMMLRKYSS